MKTLPELFEKNRKWAAEVEKSNPGFFERLSKQQTPKYLWIGCADSRVPANVVTGLEPGEVFVHRNVANLVVHTDFNFLTVLQYAVEYLKVEDIIVCGHYGCGGVAAALDSKSYGLIDNWLRNIKSVYESHKDELDQVEGKDRVNRLCELNVAAQVLNTCYTNAVQSAWERGQKLAVHGWIYGLEDGLLKDLGLCVQSPEQIPEIYRVL